MPKRKEVFMKGFIIMICVVVASPMATNLGVVKAPQITAVVEPIKPIELSEPLVCIKTGVSTTPPWLLYRDPPWSTNVQVPDFYNRDDQMLSMDIDANGRVYVVYETPWSASPLSYGWGVATSTNQGLTWDNRVYYINNPTYSLRYPEVSITTNGKIYIWGTIYGIAAFPQAPCFSRSRSTCYNNPDSLYGVTYFQAPYRLYPECVTHGPGNGLCLTQYTVDRTGATNDSVWVLFTRDSVTWYGLRFRPGGGPPERTSIGVLVGPPDPVPDTILIHAVEYFDSTGNDYDVVWYLDTMSLWRLYGWVTGNTLNDRYPSVFCSQNYAYIAIQSEMASGNNDILFDYSTDYGATWATALVNITNSPVNETYPRLSGITSNIGCNYIYGGNTVRFTYSIWYGQDGTWQTPEIVTDNTTANNSYHSTALLWTPSYCYAVWEDTRNSGTDGIEIYSARRDAPIGVFEKYNQWFGKLRLYPNPFKGKVDIQLGSELVGKRLILSVYNLSGRLITTNTIIANGSKIVWNGIDQSGHRLPAGIYVLRLNDGNKILTEKAILLQ
uniref:T9SS type A sorting domain-containing protein n=1 Tax=candidate division WOR-3 bacterium TaxID=2052148 RepID=A0A7V3RHZ3_UNCW3